ncbi:nuclease-related domain-containing protein [Mucilaginibacter psychrotolerans]|uniref:NERD domain-containing protein n=1 Tax=Mucilaginibacter psychrotolerans TaxID=1524096 RepID=A0A4Y8SQR5_9SPHI|nr:nuclease-related domain-containing protein [Mucilaginibacter psychrotolerans]TFF40931.1 hypothetical protein E2R66_01785 [Mucilaginibacter psychrotolerans]
MCKVYHEIGCLTEIKSRLRAHNIHEYKSLNEVIKFRDNYSSSRKQIISNHELLIEQEKVTLSESIVQLEHAIKEQEIVVKEKYEEGLENLNTQLCNLLSTNSNGKRSIVIYIKSVILKLRIRYTKITVNSRIDYSLKHLTDDYNKKNDRHKYIVSNFDEAVRESGSPQLNELDRKKQVIDEINAFIYGALGEHKVVKELEKLSDDYILINDFTCAFNPPIYRRQQNDYIKSIQIDHILVAPSGVFLIETKNWSKDSLNNLNLHSPVEQIRRTNFALYKIMNNEISNARFTLGKHHWGDRKIPIKNLIVLINHKPIEEFQHVKILAVNGLINYVGYFKPCFSPKETGDLAEYLLSFSK